MAKTRIKVAEGESAVAAAVAGFAPGAEPAPRDTVAMGVRYLLQCLAENSKGNTLEVRVPPFGATQCVEGPGHTRGTPPNVVEMDAATWLALATGDLSWEDGIATTRIAASGQRADLRGHVPVRR